MADYTWQDLEDLVPEWERIFGEEMPRGFEVGPDQVPIMRECIEKRDRGPLVRYVKSLPRDLMYQGPHPLTIVAWIVWGHNPAHAYP